MSKQRFLGGLLGANPVRDGSFTDTVAAVPYDFDNRSSTLALNTMNPSRTHATGLYKNPMFNGDGTKLVYGALGDRLYTANLSTAYDFDSAANSALTLVLDMGVSNSATFTSPIVSPDGTLIAHCYQDIDAASGNLFECSIGKMTTAWDFTTYSALNHDQNPASLAQVPRKSNFSRFGVIGWSPDSAKFYVIDNGEAGAIAFYQFSVNASTGAVTYLSKKEMPSAWVRRNAIYYGAVAEDHIIIPHRQFDNGAGTTSNHAWVRLDLDGNAELTNGTWSYDASNTTGLPNQITPVTGCHYNADGTILTLYVSTDGSYGGNVSQNANYHSTWDVEADASSTDRTTSNVGIVSLDEAGPEANGSNELTQLNWGGIRGRDVLTDGTAGTGDDHPGLDQPATRWSIQSDTYAVGTSDSGNNALYLDMVPTSGKYYVEFYVWNNNNQTIFCGIQSNTIEASYPMSTPGVAYYSANGNWVNGSGGFQGTGHHPGNFNAKVIGLAIDFDANKTWFHVEGVWANSGDPSSGGAGDSYSNTGTDMTAFVSANQPSATGRYASINTGNNGTFDGYVTAGGYTDTNGVGDFKYAVPTGFQGWYTTFTAGSAAGLANTGILSLSELLQASYRVVPSTVDIDYLVIGGGGSGGVRNGGGGGAGGYRTSWAGDGSEQSGRNSTPEAPLQFEAGDTFTVTVGAGGASTTMTGLNGRQGNYGNPSVFASITSERGGRGGHYRNTSRNSHGGDGGSGGGGVGNSYSLPGDGTAGQGHDALHGGGGAGSTASGTGNRDGGNGLSSTITGSAVIRAGGGGGANLGAGGSGGGGAAGSNLTGGTAGAANTGSGGGGTYGGSNGGGTSGAGGSGVVILRYPNSVTLNIPSNSNLTYSHDNSISGVTITTFTAGSGTVTVA